MRSWFWVIILMLVPPSWGVSQWVRQGRTWDDGVTQGPWGTPWLRQGRLRQGWLRQGRLGRLPGALAPRHYDLRYTFDVDPRTNFSYYGVVHISLNVRKSTAKIVLHAQDFSLSEERLTLTGDGSAPMVQDVTLNDTYNLLTLSLDGELEKGRNYTLTIPFHGNLKQGLDGVYISSYVSKKTKKKEYLISTQFEPISARKAFPCFDEPMFKATFQITIGHHKVFSAVSNMPLTVSSSDNAVKSFWLWEVIAETFKKDKASFVWDRFESSVPMSTYLVAFVVSTFSHVTSPPELSNTTCRVWARGDAIHETAYAASIGPQILTYFEKYFNIPFPLPKQDMFAIPDYAAGAMENWGLITFRETSVLYDETQSPIISKELIAITIAHELAHQWFGNLVTMKWWSDLWLKEGFADYLEAVGVAAVEPAWRAEQLFPAESILEVLDMDDLEASHPVSMPLDDPKQAEEIFDSISYEKGSVLIRMMSMFLGEAVFRKALNNYLIKYSYSNAEQDDLWAELTAASEAEMSHNASVKRAMDTWTTQPGYPLLTVARDYSDSSLTITQKRYLSPGAQSPASGSWWVPISVLQQAAGTAGRVQWLAADEGLATPRRLHHGAATHHWLLFNHDIMAPCRVNYDKRNWELLARTLTSPQYHTIPVLGRVQLVTDAFALARTNHLDYALTLQLASYLRHEHDYLPLSTGLSALSYIEGILRRSPDYGVFQMFVRRLIGDTYRRVERLGAKKKLESKDFYIVKMQTLIRKWAYSVEVPGCEEYAVRMFRRWMETRDPDAHNPVPVELRPVVYCAALSRGSSAHWRFALARRRATSVAGTARMLLRALVCSRDVWILAHYLELAIADESVVRRQDSSSVLAAITGSAAGYCVARDFVYNRTEDIYKAFHSDSSYFGDIFKALLNQFTTQKELDEFLKWRSENPKYFEESRMAVEQGIESARENIAWVARHQRRVVGLLRDHSAYVVAHSHR